VRARSVNLVSLSLSVIFVAVVCICGVLPVLILDLFYGSRMEFVGPVEKCFLFCYFLGYGSYSSPLKIEIRL